MENKGILLIFVSMVVFSVLNIIENLIHYNIGRNHNNTKFKYNIPTKQDFFEIIVVMIVFAILQGVMTEVFVKD